MYQLITIVGNLGRDPELRYLQSGKAVANFPIAVSERWSDGNGGTKDRTTWFRITVWGNQAETCNQYLTKGSRALVVGTLVADENGNPKSWVKKDGSGAGASFEISATTVRFLTPKSSGQNGDESDSDEGGESDYSVSNEPLPF